MKPRGPWGTPGIGETSRRGSVTTLSAGSLLPLAMASSSPSTALGAEEPRKAISDSASRVETESLARCPNISRGCPSAETTVSPTPSTSCRRRW